LDAAFSDALGNHDVDVIANSLKIYHSIGRMKDAQAIVKERVIEPFFDTVVNRDAVKAPSDGLEAMYDKVHVQATPCCN
jgi:hypothetical protein